MSWLNFNDSLNSLKGQISNFASNVLADEDDGSEIKSSDYKELKKICVRQELELKKLKNSYEELNNTHVQQNETNTTNNTNGSWNWNTNESKYIIDTSEEAFSNLNERIKELDREKSDLAGQLEQLDFENQQNLSKVIDMKEKLQRKCSDLEETNQQLKYENRNIVTREEKLINELKELQKFKEVHKTPNDNYNEKYEMILQDNQKLKFELEESKKELSVLKSSNDTLQKIFEDYKVTSEDESLKKFEKVKQLEAEKKIVYSELQKAKHNIKKYEEESSEDAANCQKLAFILESYEKQVSSLKHEIEEIKVQNEKLQLGAEEEMNLELKELRNIDKEHIEKIKLLTEELEELKNDNDKLKLKVKDTEDLEYLCKEQRTQMDLLEKETQILKMQNADGQNSRDFHENDEEKHSTVLLELHKKYVNIITENIKKFQDCDKPSDFQHCSCEDDPQIAEFSKQVENILKILLDFKCKCEILEKEVYSLAEEKTNILTEKNHEIEKLLQNSEILSQEVIKKTQTIKEFENECNELAKNNELLINELETHKNNSGLQTISESNEDNMVLLESQLENANKRIEDLEKIIDDYDKQQKDESLLKIDDNKSELSAAAKQLNVAESEITNKERDYQELLNSFDHLQIEYDSLKVEYETAQDSLLLVGEENEKLKNILEKVRSDYENTEYQLSEVNINIESLKEELELYKKKADNILKENNKLQMLNEESIKNNEDIRSELHIIKEKLLIEEDSKKNLEFQIRNLTEKLQNAKMAETSLKLQYDTLSKEAVVLVETKHNLEMSLNKTNSDLEYFQNNLIEFQEQNTKVVEECEELKEVIRRREQQIDDFEKVVAEMQFKLEKLETSTADEDENLSKKCSASENAAVQELQSMAAKYENQPTDNEKAPTSENIKQQIVYSDFIEKSKDYAQLKQEFDEVMQEKTNLQLELNTLTTVQTQFKETLEKYALLQQQFQEVTSSRNELINIATIKHQENVTYHNEIQRLSQYLTVESEKCRELEKQLIELKNISISSADMEGKNQEIERLTDQNNFLKEKCEVIAKNLLEEQSKVQQMVAEKLQPSEKEISLQKKLDRLQAHLIELEEHYTQELLQAEQKNAELQAKVTEIEEREKSSSTMYTSVSIRANQQVESLQNQLQTIINERDSLRKQISDAEDANSKQAAALANLQFVLEQFQKDKEKDVFKETERIRRQINVEKQIQEEFKKEISALKFQLEESKQGLLAASRLSDQLEYSKKTISSLKDEVSQLQDKLRQNEEELKNATNQTDGKVDKSLIKNLIIGFMSSNTNLNKDQMQILKIIATVLDFNQQEHDKINLNKPQQTSWLSSLLAPQPSNSNMSQESLSQAFIKFLENESKPRVVPSLLNASPTESTKSTTSSKSTTPRQSPIVLSEIVLPTFADFAQNRNSSSILKDVLKDNN